MNQAADEAIEAIRSAVRALRAAERALKLAQSAPQAPDASPSEVQPGVSDPAERALLDYIVTTVQQFKDYEEQDPQSFRKLFDPMRDDLLSGIVKGDMYQVSARGKGMVSFDNTEGTTLYETALKVMRENNIHQPDLLQPFVNEAELKNWGDVSADADLVIMRYETSGPQTLRLDEAQLQSLMEAARKTPGAIDRTRVGLAEAGIQWAVSDVRSGIVDSAVEVTGVNAKWAACIPSADVLRAVAGLLSVVEVDYENQQQGWWDLARADRDLPQQLLPIIRSKEPSIVCHRSDIGPIEEWASGIPGWYDDNSTPLCMRDAVLDDIL